MLLTILAALSLAIWLYLMTARGGYWRMQPDVFAGAPAEPAPSVTAEIPARNEAGVVERSVASLAAQKYPGEFRMILVDDASQDGTAQLALRAAPQVRVLTAGPLPAGWTGKMWAVAGGVAAAAGDYLLLTDADIVHPPEHLAELVARAQQGDYDLVSYMVRLECRSLAEQALIPAFVFFFFLLYPPAWILDPRSRTAGAASRLYPAPALGAGANRRDRAHSRRTDRRLRAGSRRQGHGRTHLAGPQRQGCQHPRIPYLRRNRPHDLAHRLHPTTLLSVDPDGNRSRAGGDVSRASLLTLAAPPGAASGMGALAWVLMTAAYWPSVRYTRRSWFWAPLLPAIALFYLCATLHSAIAHWRGHGGLWKGRTQAAS